MSKENDCRIIALEILDRLHTTEDKETRLCWLEIAISRGYEAGYLEAMHTNKHLTAGYDEAFRAGRKSAINDLKHGRDAYLASFDEKKMEDARDIVIEMKERRMEP